MITALLLSSALAADGSITVSVGYDDPSEALWPGVTLALHATNDKGFAPVGRLDVGADLSFGASPWVAAELGGMVRIPEDEAIVRVGLATRWTTTFRRHRFPIQPSDKLETIGENHIGFIPAGLALFEFEWVKEKVRYAVGGKAGVGSGLADFECALDADENRCLSWQPVFVGGFSARMRWKKGWFIEGTGGTITVLSFGRAF